MGAQVDPVQHAQLAHQLDTLPHGDQGPEGLLGDLEVQEEWPALAPAPRQPSEQCLAANPQIPAEAVEDGVAGQVAQQCQLLGTQDQVIMCSLGFCLKRCAMARSSEYV